VDTAGDLTEAELASIRELVATDSLVADKRLMLIVRLPDGSVAVKTGVQIGPMHGYGDRLLLRWESGRWLVVDRARWGS
jgi:hypothetical protein